MVELVPGFIRILVGFDYLLVAYATDYYGLVVSSLEAIGKFCLPSVRDR